MKGKKKTMKEYFAYGSNLNLGQMAGRCPESTTVQIARLEGYELAFRGGVLTIGSTGIRVSELAFITVQAAKNGRAEIHLKGKYRTILLPRKLCKQLLAYCRKNNIQEGHIFRTRNGNLVDRSNVWHSLKALCSEAGVEKAKVFPHNFRHLFARIFYSIEKNLAHLADVLGHSSLETTRIYVAVSTETHYQILNKMKLVI